MLLSVTSEISDLPGRASKLYKAGVLSGDSAQDRPAQGRNAREAAKLFVFIYADAVRRAEGGQVMPVKKNIF